MKLKDITKNVTTKKVLVYSAVGVGAYFLYKGIKKALGFSTAAVAALQEQNEFIKQGMRPSYVDSQYKLFADTIYSAGFDVLFGTDEDAIYAVFRKMNNDLDVNKLIVAFGTRRIEFSTQTSSLGGFLSSELDEKEREEINKILKAKNIKYKF
jgi:hypothetical protein